MARTPTKKSVGELITVFALTPVNHDLVEYEPGDAIEMTEAEADALLAVKAIRLGGKVEAEAPTE